MAIDPLYPELNRTQLQTLFSYEQASFANLCSKLNMKQVEVESLMLQDLKQTFVQIFDDLQNMTIGNIELPDDLKRVLNISDFWEMNRFVVALRKNEIVQDILVAIESTFDNDEINVTKLPINWQYWMDLIRNKVNPTFGRLGKSYSIEQTLNTIPHLCLFTNEYNAFLSGKYKLGPVPIICVPVLLEQINYQFLNILAPLIVSKDDSGVFGPTSKDEVQTKAKDQGFIRTCKGFFKVVFGNTLKYVVDPAVQTMAERGLEERIILDLMVSSANKFVWLHEYGHLLQGHLERQPAPKLELEADRFALFMIALASKRITMVTGQISQFILIGVIYLLIIIWVIEKKGKIVDSETHPPAVERLMYLLEKSTQLEELYARNILAALLMPT